MANIATLKARFDTGELRDGVKAMQDVAGQAAKTEAAVERLGDSTTDSLARVPQTISPIAPVLRDMDMAAHGAATGGIAVLGNQSKMLTQQLSQVAQQGMATGQWAQALAIQAADIGLAFGPIGAIMGTLSMVSVPLLVAAFGSAADAMDVSADATDAYATALKNLQADISAAEALDRQYTEALKSGSTLRIQAVQSEATYREKLLELDQIDLQTKQKAAEDALAVVKQSFDAQAAYVEDLKSVYNDFAAAGAATEELEAQKKSIREANAELEAQAQMLARAEAEFGLVNAQAAANADKMVLIKQILGGIVTDASQLPETLITAANAAQPLGQSLKDVGEWARVAVYSGSGIAGALSPAVGVSAAIATNLRSAALSFGNLAGAKIDSGSAFGFDYQSPAMQALNMDPFAPIVRSVASAGAASAAAAPKMEDMTDNLQKLVDMQVEEMEKLRNAQIQAINSFQSTLSAFGSGDIGGGISSLGGLGKTLTEVGGGFAGIGAALTGLAPQLAIAGFIFDAFKTTTTVMAQGIKLSITDLELAAQSYQTTKKSSFFGLFNHTSTTTGDATDGLTAAYGDVQQGVLDAAAALGIGADAFANFSYSFDLSLKDMSDQEKSQAIAKAFGDVSDAMAKLALGGAELPKGVTSATDYLVLLGKELEGFNAQWDKLGFNVMGVSLASGQAADSIVQLLGGLDAFTSATDYYFRTFYSTSEQLTSVTDSLSTQLGALGITEIPDTTAAFKDLVDTFQAAGDMDAVAALIKLAPEMANFLDLTKELAGTLPEANTAIEDERKRLQDQLWQLQGDIESLRAEQLAALDPSNRALQEEIWALQDAQAAAEAAAQAEAALAAERDSLQEQLWRLTGDTEALRAAQLAALDPSNRALQEQIWALEDQQAAADAATRAMEEQAAAAEALANSLKPETFKTLYDFQKAQAQALYGWASPMAPAVDPITGQPTTSDNQTTSQLAALLTALQALLAELQLTHAELAGFSKTQRDVLTKWDTIGLGTYTVATP